MFRLAVLIASLLTVAGCASLAPSERDAVEQQRPEGYTGALRVDPDPIELADTELGCVRSLSIAFHNANSERTLTIADVTLPDPALRLAAAPPFRVSPNGARIVDLHFLPVATGPVAGTIGFWTDEGSDVPAEVAISAAGLAARETPVNPDPVDLVLVVDVSTTMGALPRLRDALQDLFDRAETRGADLRVGLVTFVNDVFAHRGATFLERAAFVSELDSQLDAETGGPDLTLARHRLNFDFAENSLGALQHAASEYRFRTDVRRVLLLVTDDTFLEPPSTFSDGIPATASYRDVHRTLDEHGLALYAIHASAAGRGISSSHHGEPPLVHASGGNWLEFEDAVKDESVLRRFLNDLVDGRDCR